MESKGFSSRNVSGFLQWGFSLLCNSLPLQVLQRPLSLTCPVSLTSPFLATSLSVALGSPAKGHQKTPSTFCFTGWCFLLLQPAVNFFKSTLSHQRFNLGMRHTLRSATLTSRTSGAGIRSAGFQVLRLNLGRLTTSLSYTSMAPANVLQSSLFSSYLTKMPSVSRNTLKKNIKKCLAGLSKDLWGNSAGLSGSWCRWKDVLILHSHLKEIGRDNWIVLNKTDFNHLFQIIECQN